MLSTIVPFIILIVIVVFIHEYGHYYFAKKYGVGVTDFSIGFGKEIFGWNDFACRYFSFFYVTITVISIFYSCYIYTSTDLEVEIIFKKI